MNPLASTYLGLELRSPIVASPSPITGRIESLLRLEEAGVGAVVLPSLFEEEPKRVAKRANLLAAPPNTQGPPALKGSAKTTFKAVRGAVAGA